MAIAAQRIDDHVAADQRVHADLDRRMAEMGRRMDEGLDHILAEIGKLNARIWQVAGTVILLLLTVIGWLLARGAPWQH